jgi:hypothetical protein
LNTPQPAADRPPARAPRAAEEKASTEETLPHHAKRLVQSRLHGLERAILDPIIRLLQRLRKGTGASESPDDEGDEDRPKSRKAKPGGGRDVAESTLMKRGPKRPSRRGVCLRS